MPNVIKAQIHQGEQSGFVAECVELPVITQGQTLNEAMANLNGAINLHLQDQDLAALGLTSDVPIVINYEFTLPLSLSYKPTISLFKKEIPPYILAGVIVFALWLAAPVVLNTYFADWPKIGQFGDLFGSVNALFSGLAFVALIYTIHLQRQELSLQRTELGLQREEMVASRGELAAQVAVQKSLHRATIGQIRVAAEQARIEAFKTTGSPNSTGDINKISYKIDAIVKELESD